MEAKRIGELMPRERTELSQLSTQSQTTNEISIYQDDLATADFIKKKISSLINAFPGVSDEFVALLTDRVLKNKFTKNRLSDSIDYLVDNFRYPTPTIADVVGFDRRVKFYTYQEVCDKVSQGMPFEHYKRTTTGQYLSSFDVEMYNLGYLVC